MLTFEPHPRDYFAALLHKPEMAPARVGTLRDKLVDLANCGVDQTVVLPFDARLASRRRRNSSTKCYSRVWVRAMCWSATTSALVPSAPVITRCWMPCRFEAQGFDVARMNSYEVHGLRVSSSAVREALGTGPHAGRGAPAGSTLLHQSGHVVHGRKLGRTLGQDAQHPMGMRTLNLRFAHWKPAASGIFVVLVHGLSAQPLQGVANLGVRPSLDPNDVNGGRVLLETHCLDWPAELGAEGAYGKIIRVELLHKLHDELKYDGLDALTQGIRKDCDDARAWFA